LLGNHELACDATQETAARFLQRLPTWRGDGSLKTWSFGIALNIVREMRRARATIDPLIAGPGRARPPDEMIDALEQAELLHVALGDLPERQREALVLRFFEDLSTEQAAIAMNCAPGTVKATVHQALRALRNKLKQLA
jgi:RNA polymerase sigma-70 factor (ECF subfamily)